MGFNVATESNNAIEKILIKLVLTMALIPKEPQYDDSRQARAEYLEYAQTVIGEPSLDYPTLYGRFAENEWACIELDKAVALEALGAGRLPVEIASLLH